VIVCPHLRVRPSRQPLSSIRVTPVRLPITRGSARVVNRHFGRARLCVRGGLVRRPSPGPGMGESSQRQRRVPRGFTRCLPNRPHAASRLAHITSRWSCRLNRRWHGRRSWYRLWTRELAAAQLNSLLCATVCEFWRTLLMERFTAIWAKRKLNSQRRARGIGMTGAAGQGSPAAPASAAGTRRDRLCAATGQAVAPAAFFYSGYAGSAAHCSRVGPSRQPALRPRSPLRQRGIARRPSPGPGMGESSQRQGRMPRGFTRCLPHRPHAASRACAHNKSLELSP
jgi:hypothetical protein